MFFRNYSKPGKGVEKRDPNQPRNQIFFDILPRNLWRLVKLSVLYLLVSLPFFIVTMISVGIVSPYILNNIAGQTVASISSELFQKYNMFLNVILSFWFTIFLGQGPITAGLTYIVREWGKERPCWLISDFFARVKLNFKQGIVLWILDLIVICVGLVAYTFYISEKMYVLVFILSCIMITYILAHIYIYQIMITYDLKLRYIFRNSILIAMGKFPQSMIIILTLAFTHVVLPILIICFGNKTSVLITIAVETFILPALSSFTINFCIYPTLKKICG